jgi:septum site-determining protein MinC
MNYDAATPDVKSNSTSLEAESIANPKDMEVNSSEAADAGLETKIAVSDADSHSIIPNAELDSVLEFLQVNSASKEADATATQPDQESKAAASHPETEVKANSGDAESQATLPENNLDAALFDLSDPDLELAEQQANKNFQVQLKTEAGRMLVILPTESQLPATDFSWSEICQQMNQRLNAGDRLRIPNTPLHLVAQDRLLDSRQLQELEERLKVYQLQLTSVATSRRQTAIAAVSSGYSVEQIQAQKSFSTEVQSTPTPLADALYLEMTVRSGVEIRHPGTVVILGDINPGGIVIADGDILIWGRLRGIAHAGASGNRDCLIMALQMEPTQLRIADAVARAPEKSPTQYFPEVAHITPQGIRIARTTDFSRHQFSKISQ